MYRNKNDYHTTNLITPTDTKTELGEKKEMPTAFVLINTEIGSEEEVATELRKLEHVKESYVVYGVYDIVARVEAETMDRLK